jgi:hypothetical protein
VLSFLEDQKNMGIFDGIEHVAAEGTPSRRYFEPGNYLVTINSAFLYERRLGGGKLFIVETTVNESDNPHIGPDESCNWVQSSALPRIKAFIGACMRLCPKTQIKEINTKVTSAVCNQAVSSDNPLRGKKLRLTCVSKPTRAGKEFVQHVWGLYENM